MKRALDVVLGTVLGLAALPVILLFALVVALELRSWPFFVQERIGRHGSMFRMPKLRTLPKATNPYAEKQTLNLDVIPRLCRFLRHSHLDELPQLWLVPLGMMSLVGPRPKMPDWVEPIDPQFGHVRTRVRPGCTGLWQVGTASTLRVADTPAFDYWYLSNRTARLDIWILWRTLLLFAGLGAPRELTDVPVWLSTIGWRDFAVTATRATASVFAEDDRAEVASELT